MGPTAIPMRTGFSSNSCGAHGLIALKVLIYFSARLSSLVCPRKVYPEPLAAVAQIAYGIPPTLGSVWSGQDSSCLCYCCPVHPRLRPPVSGLWASRLRGGSRIPYIKVLDLKG